MTLSADRTTSLFRSAGGLALTLSSGLALASATTAGDTAIVRPDVSAWVTVGTTIRNNAVRTTIPEQMRQVLIDPDSYRRLEGSGRYADGTRLAVLFHSVKLDSGHAPPLYHADREVAFALEVIDRAHPDGRRFYMFEPGANTAGPLPPGNKCAVCHSQQGSFDGTFAHFYPLLAHHAAKRLR